ncbi:hypothetical protein [Nocardia sp. bgisy134]|uniref:hypothetical protein n=1 Tax=unclassified Nocardia TaxID=2637762 RepID=UPI003D7301F0
MGTPVSDGSYDDRATRTIKVFIALSFFGEFNFLLLGLILFPDHGTLVWRVVWTLGLCGIGMGAAVGGLTYLVTAGRRPGSPAGFALTAACGALALSVCQTLCWSLDHNVGLNYWGSIDMPELFLVKGYASALAGGLLGGYLLNSRRGARLLDFARV